MVGGIFGYYKEGKELLLASSEQRPRMLLSILQSIRQSPPQNDLTPHSGSAEAEDRVKEMWHMKVLGT